MRIDVSFLPVLAGRDEKERQYVVIDVLRASSTIITALANGCAGIIPAAGVDEAAKIASRMERSSVLLAGERKGIKIEGFTLGNSPLEFTCKAVNEKRVILCTSNGTKALKLVSKEKEVYVGAFLNVTALVERLLGNEQDILLLCAGSAGEFSLEDALCAGLITDLALRARPKILTGDAGRAARYLYKQTKKNLLKTVINGEHGQYLSRLGFGADVEYCMKQDAIGLIPAYRDGMIGAD